MSATESACYSTPEESGLRVETLSFERIPHQSRLFLDYLRDPTCATPISIRQQSDFITNCHSARQKFLRAYHTDRKVLCDALSEMNLAWGAGAETLANIELLREADCLAVVSGQQAGLFTGPLYTIYKALSAVKLAGCLRQRNTKAVPVFWIATEDHDFAEVAKAEFIGKDCRLASVSVAIGVAPGRTTCGHVVLDDSINGVVDRLVELLPASEFTPDLEALLHDAWKPGRGYGEAFARMMTSLIGQHGLIFLDPMHGRMKRLAAPLYASAAIRAQEIANALEVRSRELEEAGYHAQVLASATSFPLFMHDAKGERHALTRTMMVNTRLKESDSAYTAQELGGLAAREPERFSPNVTLRAVVQDYLLPTIAYLGGAAEVAYFAQTAEVYRVLERPVTPILPRSSLTMVERHTSRVLERYGLSLADLFVGAGKRSIPSGRRASGSGYGEEFYRNRREC